MAVREWHWGGRLLGLEDRIDRRLTEPGGFAPDGREMGTGIPEKRGSRDL